MLQCAHCEAENPSGARFCNECGARFASDPAPPTAPVVAPPAAPAAVPVSVSNGRYELVRLLGEGGKKLVYLAKDSLLGRDVALALIKADGLDAGGRERVLREAQAMGRLGAHPNIVAVFDLGEEQGRPFMVTELMGGGDLEGLLEHAPGGGLAVERVVELARGVCNGLVFAHGQGVIHRDLKPGNVWLTGDGVAKIGDFGLALASERSRLTQEGTMVGTVSYMPPEQALGGETTARADLYSLGAMLYELLTGRPPFLADDPVAVISQHINTPPVALSWHLPECPRALEALVLRLLAKDPSERPASAADVLAALDGMDLAETVQPAVSEGDATSLEGLASGVFVGRRQELSGLKALLEGVLSGEGRMVTVVGEPGIGKTRVCLELATFARLRGARVLWGRCYESEGAPAYWPWVQALRDYVRERDPQQLQHELGAGAVEIAEIVPDVRQRLPGLPEPSRSADPQQARFRLFDALTAFLKTSSRNQPLVLVLDDLQWADEASLKLLEFVARELTGARLMLVGTYRDIELNRRHPLSTTLAELTRERLFERILLRGLSRDDIGRFVEATCGLAPPDGLVGLIHTQTEGNPLFVTEIVRLLVQEGELTRERLSGEQSWSLRIPEGVREVIGRRLDRLSERCNETLTIASVVGREFSHEQLKALIDDLSDDRLLDVLEEALAAHVIEELPRSLGRYQFSHALIQETLSGELSLTRRVRLHTRIAEALEALYGADADRHADELAHHYAEAQSLLGSDKLIHYSQIAGEAALDAHAYEQALTHFQRGLGARSDDVVDDQSAALLYGLGRAQLAAVSRDEMGLALANLVRAFDFYAREGQRDRAVAVAVVDAPIPWREPAYLEMLQHALTLVSPDSPEQGRLLAAAAYDAALNRGEYDEAQATFQRARAIAANHNDTTLEHRVLRLASQSDVFHTRWQDGVEHGMRSLELMEPGGDLYSTLVAHGCVAVCSRCVGESEQARAHLVASLALSEPLQEHFWLDTMRWNSAQLQLMQGAWEGARTTADETLSAAPESGCRCFALLGYLEHELGNRDAGATFLSRLRDRVESGPPPGPYMEHELLVGMIALVGRTTDSDEGYDTATTIAERLLAIPGLAPLHTDAAKQGLALIAVQQKDRDTAAQLYDELAPTHGTSGYLLPVSNDRILGLLAASLGRSDTAITHYEDALAFCERAGYRPEHAWAAADYAELLLDRDQPDDHDRAIRLQDTALVIARELGMQPLMQRILARRELLKA